MWPALGCGTAKTHHTDFIEVLAAQAQCARVSAGLDESNGSIETNGRTISGGDSECDLLNPLPAQSALECRQQQLPSHALSASIWGDVHAANESQMTLFRALLSPNPDNTNELASLEGTEKYPIVRAHQMNLDLLNRSRFLFLVA